VWRRTPNQLTYSLLGLHKLVPPPSRVNNNATISLLCAAASAWVSHTPYPFGLSPSAQLSVSHDRHLLALANRCFLLPRLLRDREC